MYFYAIVLLMQQGFHDNILDRIQYPPLDSTHSVRIIHFLNQACTVDLLHTTLICTV